MDLLWQDPNLCGWCQGTVEQDRSKLRLFRLRFEDGNCRVEDHCAATLPLEFVGNSKMSGG
jgi:hypothetical protein